MENMENNEFVEVVETPVVAQPVVETQPVVEAQPASNGKGMSIAALVCGIVGIVGSFLSIAAILTLILAILGIVFGSKGLKIAESTGQGKGMATAGLVLGIIGTAFSAIGVLCTGCLICTGVLASM